MVDFVYRLGGFGLGQEAVIDLRTVCRQSQPTSQKCRKVLEMLVSYQLRKVPSHV